MDLNLLFFEETEKSFGFLIQDHGCRSVRKVQPGWNDAQIIYQDGSTAVTISLEWSYPGLFVIFSRLVDGQLPEFPGHGKFHPIYLDALISLRAPQFALSYETKDLWNGDKLRGFIRRYAELTREHGLDILKMDFPRFVELEESVRNRAAEGNRPPTNVTT